MMSITVSKDKETGILIFNYQGESVSSNSSSFGSG